MAATARVIWLCACVRYYTGVRVCHLLLLLLHLYGYWFSTAFIHQKVKFMRINLTHRFHVAVCLFSNR